MMGGGSPLPATYNYYLYDTSIVGGGVAKVFSCPQSCVVYTPLIIIKQPTMAASKYNTVSLFTNNI